MMYAAELKVKTQTLTRENLLKMLSVSVHALTIAGRFHFQEPDELPRLRQINEAIHRLSGHLKDLCDPNEPYTPGRADGICLQLEILPQSSLKRLYKFVTQLS